MIQRIRRSVQDGNREFISLLACISVIRHALPPALIYQGNSFDLQDTWVDEVGVNDEAHFASLYNGWSSDAFGLHWHKQVFDHYTWEIARNHRRLFIVDRHSSHVNMVFLNKCN